MKEDVITVSISKKDTAWGDVHVRAEGLRGQAKQVADAAREALEHTISIDKKNS